METTKHEELSGFNVFASFTAGKLISIRIKTNDEHGTHWENVRVDELNNLLNELRQVKAYESA